LTIFAGRPGRSRPERVLDLLIRAGLVLIVLLAPLPFGSVETWAFSTLELGVAVVALVWLYRLFLFPSTPIVWSPLYLPPLFFLLLMGLQLVPLLPGLLRFLSPNTAAFYARTVPGYDPTSRNLDILEAAAAGEASPQTVSWRPISQAPHATRLYLMKGVALTLFLFLLLNAFHEAKRIHWLLYAFVATGTLQAFYGLIEYLSGHQHIFAYQKRYYTDAATGTFINRNHFAGFLEMVLLAALGLLYSRLREPQTARGWRNRLLALTDRRASLNLTLLFCIGIIAIALVLSYSRAGIILGLSAAGLFCLNQVRHQWSATRLVLVVLLASAVLLPAYGVGYWTLTGRYAILTEELSSPGGRLAVWKKTLEIARDFPVFGTGVGTFQYVFPRYRPASVTAFYDYAHNDYIQILSETGIPGLLLGAWGIILAGRLWLRRLPQKGSDTILRSATGFGLLAMALHETVDFGLQIPANLLAFAFLAGCLALLLKAESRLGAEMEPGYV